MAIKVKKDQKKQKKRMSQKTVVKSNPKKTAKKKDVKKKAVRNAQMGGVAKQVIGFPLKVLQPLINYLKNEEKRLKEKKANLKNEDPFADDSRVDDNSIDADVAEQVNHETVSAMQQQINRSLASIRTTMTRIKLGKYGICEECHKMIDTDRLAINPTAQYCVKCEAKLESKGGKRK